MKLLKRKRKSTRVEILGTHLGFGIEQNVSGLTWFSPLTHITLIGGSDTTKRVQVHNNEINGTKTGRFTWSFH